jgi:hypothetical protein
MQKIGYQVSSVLDDVQFIMIPSTVRCYGKHPAQWSGCSQFFAARLPPYNITYISSQYSLELWTFYFRATLTA